MRSKQHILLISTLLLVLVSVATTCCAAPKAELWSHWQPNDPQSSLRVDHAAWARFLDKYLVSGQHGAASLVRYAAVNGEDKQALSNYLATLSSVAVSKLSSSEQKAFWINLYNALTINTILAHYPIESIRDIRSGWFSSGPWDLKLVRVAGIDLSLNDIEHRILRPIWQDNRVHYAVNCASLGCPNLQPQPFTAENSERLLAKAADDFINSPRAVSSVDGQLVLSSIYDWFQEDFGNSIAGVIAHLAHYAAPELQQKLHNSSAAVDFAYDWRLNKQPQN